jgi:hypothetical protein
MKQLTTPAGTTADDDWQDEMLLDNIRASWRRVAKRRDINGDWVPGSYEQILTNVRCQIHHTANFDRSVPAGQIKQANIFTSDRLTLGIGADVRDGDLLDFVSRGGTAEWFVVDGVPQVREITGHQKVNLVNTVERPDS